MCVELEAARAWVDTAQLLVVTFVKARMLLCILFQTDERKMCSCITLLLLSFHVNFPSIAVVIELK